MGSKAIQGGFDILETRSHQAGVVVQALTLNERHEKKCARSVDEAQAEIVALQQSITATKGTPTVERLRKMLRKSNQHLTQEQEGLAQARLTCDWEREVLVPFRAQVIDWLHDTLTTPLTYSDIKKATLLARLAHGLYELSAKDRPASEGVKKMTAGWQAIESVVRDHHIVSAPFYPLVDERAKAAAVVWAAGVSVVEKGLSHSEGQQMETYSCFMDNLPAYAKAYRALREGNAAMIEKRVNKHELNTVPAFVQNLVDRVERGTVNGGKNGYPRMDSEYKAFVQAASLNEQTRTVSRSAKPARL